MTCYKSLLMRLLTCSIFRTRRDGLARFFDWGVHQMVHQVKCTPSAVLQS